MLIWKSNTQVFWRVKMLETEYLTESFESFSKPNVHIATSSWEPLKNTILNVYAEMSI